MKKLLIHLLILSLLLSGCGGKNSGSEHPPGETPSGGSVSSARLEVPLRCSLENGTILEVPQIVGEENDATRSMNAELKDWYTELEAAYYEEEYAWGEVLAYPTETDRYLNAVISFCEYPTYGTYGQVFSRVYDKETQEQILLEDALTMAGTSEAVLLEDFLAWNTERGSEMETATLDSLAFRMLPDGQPQFLASVTLEATDSGEYWTSFYTWTDGVVGWPCDKPVDPAEIILEFEGGSLFCQTKMAEASDEVYLSWTGEHYGTWPFEQTLEVLQFCNHDDPELEDANESMRMEAEDQLLRFETALEKGEAQCTEDGESWGSLWAYPVTGERYLSAVTVWREHMHFRIDETRTWNLVSSFVYDKEEQRLISLEEAFDRMGVDQGTLEQEIWEYVKAQNIGDYEDLSSIGFYMDPEGHPVFIIGAVVYIPVSPAGWTTFFNWDNGEIRWCDEEPLPLSLVDTEGNDELSCLQGMGQYDGAAIISEQEAFDALAEIYEVQEYLSQGMSMMNDGTTAWIDGEEHVCIALGTDHDDHFVSEMLYAVSFYSVYYMDPVYGEWIPVGFG